MERGGGRHHTKHNIVNYPEFRERREDAKKEETRRKEMKSRDYFQEAKNRATGKGLVIDKACPQWNWHHCPGEAVMERCKECGALFCSCTVDRGRRAAEELSEQYHAIPENLLARPSYVPRETLAKKKVATPGEALLGLEPKRRSDPDRTSVSKRNNREVLITMPTSQRRLGSLPCQKKSLGIPTGGALKLRADSAGDTKHKGFTAKIGDEYKVIYEGTKTPVVKKQTKQKAVRPPSPRAPSPLLRRHAEERRALVTAQARELELLEEKMAASSYKAKPTAKLRDARLKEQTLARTSQFADAARVQAEVEKLEQEAKAVAKNEMKKRASVELSKLRDKHRTSALKLEKKHKGEEYMALKAGKDPNKPFKEQGALKAHGPECRCLTCDKSSIGERTNGIMLQYKAPEVPPSYITVPPGQRHVPRNMIVAPPGK